MRIQLLSFILTLTLFSCKKEDTKVNPPISEKLTGNFSGELVWYQMDQPGDTVVVFEPQNGSITISFVDEDSMKVTLNTTTPATSVIFEISVTGKTYSGDDIIVSSQPNGSCRQITTYYFAAKDSVEYIVSGNCTPNSYVRFAGRRN